MPDPTRRSLRPFGVSVFTEYTELANRHEAVNLSQGFPDFDGPAAIIEAAVAAMRAGHNQYAPSPGLPALRRAVAAKVERLYGLSPDPQDEVTVFCGATEAIFSTIMALVEPGDEVVLIEPAYDSYAPSVAMAGGTVRWVPLDPDDLSLDLDALAAAMGPRTKLVVINTPMNPTGKVFDVGELAAIGELARRHDAFVVCDEVYEHLTYGGRVHTPAATLDGLFERTVTISSTAKTFSMTGWKVGYAVAPPALSRAIRMSHQFVTFCTPMPFQHAMAAAIDGSDDFYPELLAEYDERRRLFGAALEAAGFRIVPPQGTYYVMADITPLGVDDDVEFCRMLPERFGVAAIPVSAFYRERRMGRHLVRFAFCKRTEVLERAGERLQTLRRVLG